MSELREIVSAVNNVMIRGLKSGEQIGYQAGMLRAIAICEAKSKLHAEYLPPNFYYKDGNHDQAATCGRRDECLNLAYEIREALKNYQAAQAAKDRAAA